MKNYITLILLFLYTISSISQIKFEKGYFINNDGLKTECFIKNLDWRNNPDEIIYKLSESGEKLNSSIKNILEFGVYEESKFEKHIVNIDISVQNLQKMSTIRNPKWEKRTLFLKVLVEGNAILYKYTNNNQGFKYFYKIDTSQVKQLIYKKYMIKNGNRSENLTFINQLFKEVNCKSLSIDKVANVDYNQKSLTNYFEKNNICANPDLENEIKIKRNKAKFNFKITPGVNYSSLSMRNSLDRYKNSYDFDSELNIRIGAEFEYIFPFNKNKWSLFIDPNYYSYSSQLTKEKINGFPTIKEIVNIDVSIKRFVFPIGVRYNFFLNDNVKVFINTGVRYDSNLGSSIDFLKKVDLELNSSMFNLFGGIGTNIINKYSVEFRFFSADYLKEYTYWSSDFNTISFILGYNFL